MTKRRLTETNAVRLGLPRPMAKRLMAGEGVFLLPRPPSPRGRPRGSTDSWFWWAAVELKRAGHPRRIRWASKQVAKDARSYRGKGLAHRYSWERIRHLHADVEKLRTRFPDHKMWTDFIVECLVKLHRRYPSANVYSLISRLRSMRIRTQRLQELLFPCK
jgi:hypothetical protein